MQDLQALAERTRSQRPESRTKWPLCPVAVPEPCGLAARRAPIRVMILGALGLGLRSARCPWRRAARLARRAGCRSNPGCSRTFQRIGQTAAARPASRWNSRQRAIGRWRPRRFARILPPDAPKVRPSSCAIGKALSSTRAAGCKDREGCAIHCRKIDGSLFRHARQVNPTRGTYAREFARRSLCRVH